MTSFDEHELARLAADEHPALLAFARRRLADRPDDAEDAVQEALVKALRAVRGGSRPENARAWLFTIVAHCCADVRTGAARRPTVAVPEGRELPDAAPSVARTVESRAEVRSAVRAIAALPEAQRQALVGYELGGDTYEELGARHGWSVSATKSLLWRARSRLVEERAGWAAWGGAPLAALRALVHVEKPASLLAAAPWGAEALGCATVAVLGAAAIGLPTTSPEPASAAPAAEAAQRAAPHAPRAAAGTLVVRGGDTAHAVVARSSDPRAVIAACAAREPLTGRFTGVALLRAQRSLPVDASEYTGCSGAIDRALVRG